MIGKVEKKWWLTITAFLVDYKVIFKVIYKKYWFLDSSYMPLNSNATAFLWFKGILDLLASKSYFHSLNKTEHILSFHHASQHCSRAEVKWYNSSLRKM